VASDRSDQCLKFLTTLINVILNPTNNGLVYFMLTTDVQFVSPYYLPQTQVVTESESE